MAKIILKHRGKRSEHASIADASAEYARIREESGEGASTFPEGELRDAATDKYLGYLSYNGRAWEGRPRDWSAATKPLADAA